MSEDELIKLVNGVIWEWALEEYDANDNRVSLYQRFEENYKSFVFSLIAEWKDPA